MFRPFTFLMLSTQIARSRKDMAEKVKTGQASAVQTPPLRGGGQQKTFPLVIDDIRTLLNQCSDIQLSFGRLKRV